MKQKYSWNPWRNYLGDCPVIDSYLSNKTQANPFWACVHFLNIFLRAVGQPAFVNNPICGAIILASFFVHETDVGLAAIMGGSIATIGEMIAGLQPRELSAAGVSTFNGMLVGLVGSAVYPVFYDVERPIDLWIFTAVGAFISVYLSGSMCKMLSKLDLPYLAVPFNITIVCIFLTLRQREASEQAAGAEETAIVSDTSNATDTLEELNKNATDTEDVDMLWTLGRGTLISLGQVWGIDNVSSSLVMCLALFLMSPLLLLICLTGGLIGSVMGWFIILEPSEYWEISAGLWGYNSLLTMGALTCVFYPLGPHSMVLGLVGAIATPIVQVVFRIWLVQKCNVPYFTWPMSLVTLALMLAEGNGGLTRTQEMSIPEKQCVDHWGRQKVPQSDEDEKESV